MGLKDQSLALKWISENIKFFGGDPKRVTIVGCSAGAVSVHYHYLSPMSAGLFQNGISMSGVSMNPWVLEKNPMQNTMNLAKSLNCSTSSSKTMILCLKRLPASEIVEASDRLMVD